jgi:mannose-6-phosphate isomerase-like protein (cupin superfamily)
VQVDVLAAPLADRTLAPPGSELVIAEWFDPGGNPNDPMPIAPLHVHHSDDEAWYVLEGALAFRVGDDEVEATAGDCVIAPRGQPHTFWNPSAERCRYLIVMTRNINAIIEELHELSEWTPEVLAAVFRRHDSELVD